MLFVGTARAKDQEGWEMQMAKAKAEVAEATDDESRKVATFFDISIIYIYREREIPMMT